MRFVTQYPKFGIQIRPERTRLTADGEVIVRQEGIIASFRSGYSQRDYDVACEQFQFRGLYQNENQATLVDPAYRIAYYDTDEEQERQGWDDETREEVERKMMSSRSYGRAYVLVPDIVLQPPWPLYHDFDGTAEDLVLTVHNVIGIPFETVLEYEQSKQGENREDVIEALKTAIEVRDAGKVVLT